MLHSQILYERHRREILGMRNRTLLGLTKKSRTLEEENTALVSHDRLKYISQILESKPKNTHPGYFFQVDQLKIVDSEISELFGELEALRREKHDVEEERALNDKRRDKEAYFLFPPPHYSCPLFQI